MASVEAADIPERATAAHIIVSWAAAIPDVQVTGVEKTIPIVRGPKPGKDSTVPATPVGEKPVEESKR